MTTSRSLTAIAVGYVASVALYPRLPGPYLPVDRPLVLARPFIAFLLPTAAVVIYTLLGHLRREDRVSGADPMLEATYDGIIFRVILFVIVLHLLLLTDLVGAAWVRAWAGRGVLILLGLLLISVGNLLPRTRPNLVIGIRTSRTIADRRLWMHTHRVSGYLSVGLGATVATSGMFLGGPSLPHVVGTAAIAAAAVLFVSYRRYGRA